MQEHADHFGHHAHDAAGPGQWSQAISATLHCLTGCAIGEVLGVALVLIVAFVVTVPVNRWLIARGKGDAVVHEFHH